MREVSSWESERKLGKKVEKGQRPGVQARLGLTEVEQEMEGAGKQKNTQPGTERREPDWEGGEGTAGWQGGRASKVCRREVV